MNGSGYHYRITIDLIEEPHPQAGGEGALQSLSFFACTPNDLFAEANRLRDCLGCGASHAARLATGLSLVGEPAQPLEAIEERPSRNLGVGHTPARVP